MISEARMKDIDLFVEENKDRMFDDIAKLISVNSVNGAPEENAPFGAGPAEALRRALEISRGFGLATVNDGYMGYASTGDGSVKDKYLATITHLDVVPTGGGWNSDPFTMVERDGYILGRGVIDDKGPSVLCLYALKYLLDRKVPLKYEVRALLGVNEEIGMEDLDWYLKNYSAPVFCFSPDADFPLVNGEKGIFHGLIKSKPLAGNIVSINGGLAANAVPDSAEAVVLFNGKNIPVGTDKVCVKAEDGRLHISATGIGGHASLPQGTENAIGLLVEFLLENKLVTDEEEQYLSFIMKLHCATDGSGLGIDADDGLFDPLTAIGGVIGQDESRRIYQTIDVRYPTNMSGEKLVDIISSCGNGIVEVEVLHDTVPFYMSIDNPAVKVCIDAYNLITGENARPFTIGGGTYARHFPNAASFGPEHNDRPMPEWCGSMHGANEAASKDDLLEALKVYIVALLELEELDF